MTIKCKPAIYNSYDVSYMLITKESNHMRS